MSTPPSPAPPEEQMNGQRRTLAIPALVTNAFLILLAVPVLADPLLAPSSQTDAPETSARIVFWAAVAVLAVAQITLLVVELRRQRPSSPTQFPRLAGRAMEIVWLLLPLTLIGLLLVLTWPILEEGV